MIAGLNSELCRKGRTIHIQSQIRNSPLVIFTEIFVQGHLAFTKRAALMETMTEDEVRVALSQAHRAMHAYVSGGKADSQLFKKNGSIVRASAIPLANARPSQSESEKA